MAFLAIWGWDCFELWTRPSAAKPYFMQALCVLTESGCGVRLKTQTVGGFKLALWPGTPCILTAREYWGMGSKGERRVKPPTRCGALTRRVFVVPASVLRLELSDPFQRSKARVSLSLWHTDHPVSCHVSVAILTGQLSAD